MCRVKQCCCGCSLQTGAITCCVLTALTALSHFIYGSRIVSAVSQYKNGELQPPPDWSSDKFDSYMSILNVLAGFALLSAILGTLAFIAILIGIVANHAGCVMVWLVVEMVTIVSSCILGIIYFSSGPYYVVAGFIAIAGNALAIYFWIVVKSYYHELNEGAVGQQSLGDSKGAV